MALVHFVKDGKLPNGEQLTISYEVSANRLAPHVDPLSMEHSECPPTINPEVRASQLSEYRHVVLEILPDEAGSSPFFKPGFYYVPDAQVQAIGTALDLNVPAL